ncbi:MAG: glycosyltransferase family 2 protein [Prevotellaceae bacterium]|jgi:GT2 family glycosyltransferase|nr:glycosyltransferase family 2 protein [Prevotellaceae bacterium]
MQQVAVVILNWNGCELLRSFLPSVVQYSQADGAVVYVADNGSTDASRELLSREFPTVRLIALERNYGFAEGYNRALEQVDATYAVLLNSDVEVTPHWLVPLHSYMEAHPRAAACQPKLLSRHRRNYFEYAGAAGGYLDCYGYPFCRGRILQTVEEDRGQYDGAASPLLWATGAALFIRLSDYRSAGGLDARFFAHMEEIDLCWRLRSRGHIVACVPQSTVYHLGAATLRKEHPRKTFLNFRNNLLMLYKNLPEAELKPVLRMRALLDGAALLLFLLKGQGKNAQAVWQARREFRALRSVYADVRAENLRQTTVCHPPERTRFSILLGYYLLGKRRFTQYF